MRIDQALALGRQLQSDTAQLDAELLLAEVLQVQRSYLMTWPERSLSTSQKRRYEQLLARRRQGEPVAHILGRQGFWNLELAVSSATLIPRPDTETLVDLALSECRKERAEVLDLGTGTGAIALALATERPHWCIVAVEVVPEAVALARQNTEQLGLENVEVLQSCWFDQLAGRQFDLIVSNPPYIDPDDPHLHDGDVRFEPASALVAGEAGLADLRHIASCAQGFLRAGGQLMMEHGYDQGAQVAALMRAYDFVDVKVTQDLAGRDRVTSGYKPESE